MVVDSSSIHTTNTWGFTHVLQAWIISEVPRRSPRRSSRELLKLLAFGSFIREMLPLRPPHKFAAEAARSNLFLSEHGPAFWKMKIALPVGLGEA